MKNYALITGATSGIGYELAKLFAQDGYNLILVARDQDNLDRVHHELSQFANEIVTLSTDLANPGSSFSLYSDVEKLGLQVDVLVNNAG